MKRATPGKDLTRSSIEFRSFRGKNDQRKYYLMVKGHVRGADFFKIFSLHELKRGCMDIIGIPETPANAKQFNANKLAETVWYKNGIMRFPRKP